MQVCFSVQKSGKLRINITRDQKREGVLSITISLQPLFLNVPPFNWPWKLDICYPLMHTVCCRQKHWCTVMLQCSCWSFPPKKSLTIKHQIWLLSELRVTICLQEHDFKRKFEQSKGILGKSKLRHENSFYKAIGNDRILPLINGIK